MPSISQSRLNEMNSQLERLERTLTAERDTKLVLGEQVRNFDEILEKIVRAAQGQPIVISAGYGLSPGVMNYDNSEQGHRCTPLTVEERLIDEIRTFQEQVIFLSDRLAAVTAVATFAKEHKA